MNSQINIAGPQPLIARWLWLGHKHRSNCITWALTSMRPTYSRDSPTPCFTPTLPHAHLPMFLGRNTLERSALWAHGISGDLPIVLVRIDETEDLEIVRQLLRAHEYWRMKQLSADLVVINERSSSYAQELQVALEGLVRGSRLRLSPDTSNVRGSIFLLRADLISPQERALLQTVARSVLLSRRGTLSEQITRSQRTEAVGASHPEPTPRGQTPGRAASPAAPRIFQRPGRICREGPRICDCSGRRFADSRAMDQRDCESFVWLPCFGIRLGPHLVAQQS